MMLFSLPGHAGQSSVNAPPPENNWSGIFLNTSGTWYVFAQTFLDFSIFHCSQKGPPPYLCEPRGGGSTIISPPSPGPFPEDVTAFK